MAKERRGICSACGEDRAVTATGKVRQHFRKGEYGFRLSSECSGTEQPPASFVDPSVALVAAAEARGYLRAIDDLRDEGALLTWWQTAGPKPDAYLPVNIVLHLADYLAGRLPSPD